MGVFNLVSLALFAMGCLAADNPNSINKEFWKRGKKWVVLVAGSSGWDYYRHQADICHAYQIVKKNGIPEENIITMMVDDIAYNSQNPTPGKIINKPDGDDVYQGVVIDYTNETVTKSNFLKIITGDKNGMQSIGSGKVVEGGPHDTIFINFVSHGGTGVLAFPDGLLHADELNNAFNTMNENGSYKKILLYIEARQSGSMFDGILSDNTNILSVTAAGPREDAYGCYCNSIFWTYYTCLGDLFSVSWMEDLDMQTSKQAAKKQKIFHYYSTIRTKVHYLSNVMVYGDLEIGSDTLSSFIGYPNISNDVSSDKQQSIIIKNTVSSRDVYENNIHHMLANDKLSHPETLKLSAELDQNNRMRSVIDSVFRNIYSEVVKARPDIKSEIGDFDKPNNLKLNLDMFPCYRNILNQITENCFSLSQNPYVLNHLTIFANLCVVDNQIQQRVGSIVTKSCSNITTDILNVH